ncbi:MAG: phenylalanine--tRNA ligase subunit beta [Pseudomonadota bacterium]
MKFTFSWLKQFLETESTPEQIIDGLNRIGFEVEEVINQAEIYKPFLIAKIISATPHPDADRLKICQVDSGKEILQIICGAPNARSGIKVVLAPVGSEIPTNGLIIKKSKIRNIDSCGMLCSGAELGLSTDSAGIIELEEKYNIGESFAKEYGLNEIIIEIAITPNRGDCLGVYGIARDLAAAGFGKLKELKVDSINGSYRSPIDVKLNDSKTLKYIGRHFKNIQNSMSPEWLQRKLKAIGLNPISALVDITNYFTFAYGRPLHVYDADLIDSIEGREALRDEEFTALNDKKYKLTGGESIITDNKKIIALAGIIGEKTTGVSLNTKNIFLEIGLFDQDAIVKSARAHQIDTDAKFRFERKVDPEFMETALSLVTQMILEICGGEPSHPIIINNYKHKFEIIEFPLSELKKRIGIEYKKERVISILQDLGCELIDNEDILVVTPPSWRHDITIKEDIVEEIVRIDGFDKIPTFPLPKYEHNILDLKQRNRYRITRFAASLGLNEVVTWSFMNSKKASYFTELKDELYIKNPISSELNYMRPSTVPNLLEVAEHNQNRGINNIQIFEIASVFNGVKPDQQIYTITGLRKGYNNDKNIYGDYRPIDLFDSKADIFNIISELGLDPNKLQYDTKNIPIYFHPGRSAALTLGKQIIGYFGELHPKIIQLYNLNGNACCFELFLDNIPASKSKYGRKGNIQISDYQSVERDFAFILDKNVSCDSIIRSVSQIDKKLIKEVKIFDIFSGKNIEEGIKSVAFSVILQADDRTLSESEINNVSNNIIDTIIKNSGGTLRCA